MSAKETDDESDFIGFSPIKEKISTDSDIAQANALARELHVYKPGIEFVPGAKLEVLDARDNKWYLCKVVEVDWGELDILVHYERWSIRFDEWLKMDSTRIRPVSLATQRRESRRSFKIGEKVLAFWAPDGRMYNAQITKQISEDHWNVLFFDGFTKTLRTNLIKKIIKHPSEIELKTPVAATAAAVAATSEPVAAPPPVPGASATPEGTGVASSADSKRNIFSVEILKEKRKTIRKPDVEELFQALKKRKRSDTFSDNEDDLAGGGGAAKPPPLKKKLLKEAPGAAPDEESPPASSIKVEPPAEAFNANKRPSYFEVDVGEGFKKICRKKSDLSPLGRWDVYYLSPELKKLRSRQEVSKEVYSRSDSALNPSIMDFSIKTALLEYERQERKKEAFPKIDKINEPKNLMETERKISIDESLIKKEDLKNEAEEDANEVSAAEDKEAPFIEADVESIKLNELLSLNKENPRTKSKEYPGIKSKEYPSTKSKEYPGTKSKEYPGTKSKENPGTKFKESPQTNFQENPGTKLKENPGTKSLASKFKGPLLHIPHVDEIKKSPIPMSTRRSSVGTPRLRTPVRRDPSLTAEIAINIAESSHICPKKGCGKSFRKESLLQMHMKHYHPDLLKRKSLLQAPNVADLAYARTVGDHLDSCSDPSSSSSFGFSPEKNPRGGEKRSPSKTFLGFDTRKSVTMDLSPLTSEEDISTSDEEGEEEEEDEDDEEEEEIDAAAPPPDAAAKDEGASSALPDPDYKPSVRRARRSSRRTSRKSNEAGEETPGGSWTEPGVNDEDDAIIHCGCGSFEEDGLMLQCDVCLCWQHGSCYNIDHVDHVPDKYICSLCENPKGQRSSMRFRHHQDWLKEGKLPRFSFSDSASNTRLESSIRKGHELTANVLQLSQLIHSLRLKLRIAKNEDHPKFVMWYKKWIESKDDLDKADDMEEMSEASIPVSDLLNAFTHPVIASQIQLPESEFSQINLPQSQLSQSEILQSQLCEPELLQSQLSQLGIVSSHLDTPDLSQSKLTQLIYPPSQSELDQSIVTSQKDIQSEDFRSLPDPSEEGAPQTEQTVGKFSHSPFQPEGLPVPDDDSIQSCPGVSGISSSPIVITKPEEVPSQVSEELPQVMMEVQPSKFDVKIPLDVEVIPATASVTRLPPVGGSNDSVTTEQYSVTSGYMTEDPVEGKTTIQFVDNSGKDFNAELKGVDTKLNNSGAELKSSECLGGEAGAELSIQNINADFKSNDSDLTVKVSGSKDTESELMADEVTGTEVKVADAELEAADATLKVDTEVKVADAELKVTDTELKGADTLKITDTELKVADSELKITDTELKVDLCSTFSTTELPSDTKVDPQGETTRVVLDDPAHDLSEFDELFSSQGELEQFVHQASSVLTPLEHPSAMPSSAPPIIPETERIEPIKCKQNLLRHVERTQNKLTARFDYIEDQIKVLEGEMGLTSEFTKEEEEIMCSESAKCRNPVTLQARLLIQLILKDLDSVKRMTEYTTS